MVLISRSSSPCIPVSFTLILPPLPTLRRVQDAINHVHTLVLSSEREPNEYQKTPFNGPSSKCQIKEKRKKPEKLQPPKTPNRSRC